MTVRQPWAWAIIHGGKDVENRSRNIAGQYRGPVAIHVGLTDAPDGWAAVDPPFHDRAGGNYGAIIGVVDLVDVHYSGDCYHDSIMRAATLFKMDRPAFYALPTTCNAGGLIGRASFCSPWADDDVYHLVLSNPRPLSEPIPYRGALGLRELPADAVARIEAAL